MTAQSLAMRLNAAALYAVALVLAAAFAAQLALRELPCPLCLLQRVAFAALAFGPILNLRFGPRPSHYGVTLLAALLGALFSGRQILLHLAPGDPGYGSALFGLHYYSWAFLAFAAALVLTALVLLLDRQFAAASPPPLGRAARAAIWLVVALTFANAAGTYVECGMNVCPDNPTRYEMLKGR